MSSTFVKKAESAGILAKDSTGVIMLADLLSHIEYVLWCFKDSEKDTGMLDTMKDALMKAIQAQATDKDTKEAGASAEDIAKAMGTELSKVMGPVLEKVAGIEKSIGEFRTELDAINSTRVSVRPRGSAPVEKGFSAGGSGEGFSAKDLEAKEAELTKVDEEINAHALDMKGKASLDPSLVPAMQKKGEELFTKRQGIVRELNQLKGVA